MPPGTMSRIAGRSGAAFFGLWFSTTAPGNTAPGLRDPELHLQEGGHSIAGRTRHLVAVTATIPHYLHSLRLRHPFAQPRY